MGTSALGETRHATASEHGLLTRAGFTLRRALPAGDLAELVERHWLVEWDLPPGGSAVATLLPQPCVNVVLDSGRLFVAGVGRDRFDYPLRGSGRVFGVKFRPGGFLPLLGRPVAELTGQTVPASEVWGSDADRLGARLASYDSFGEQIAAAETFLRDRWPAITPEVELVGDIARALLFDRSISRVDDVTSRFGVRPRTLQRLFHRYVGVSPKWMLRLYRLHEAAALLAEQTDRPWAQIAADLGYFDQSHFIRDFVAAVGVTPGEYATACAQGRSPFAA